MYAVQEHKKSKSYFMLCFEINMEMAAAGRGYF